jgi:hypothetical protein
MNAIRQRSRWVAWLAMGLLVLAAVWPALAQAWVRGNDQPAWLEVCSSTGMVRVLADGQPDADPAGALDTVQAACEWCTLHGGVTGLPAADTAPTLPVLQTLAPEGGCHNAALPTRWQPAQSRAPPART